MLGGWQVNPSDILAKAMRLADEAEVFYSQTQETTVSFEADHLKRIETRHTDAMALRVIKQGRLGYSITTDLKRIDELVSQAIETSEFGVIANFELPEPSEYPLVSTYDPSAESWTTDSMVEVGEGMIQGVKSHYPDVNCDAGVSKVISSLSIVNSKGVNESYSQTTSAAGIEGMLVRDTDMLFVGEEEASCCPIYDISSIVGTVLTQLEHAKINVPPPTGKMPTIFTPHGVASALLGPLMSALNGKNVLDGSSPLAGKLGQSVFAPSVWLWDNPTLDFRPESRPFDDEGIPSQCTPLIQEGTVSSFLYDLRTAAMAHTKSTGNGARYGAGPPSPAPSAFVMQNGNTSSDAMIAGLTNGLIIDFLMGAEQGNTLSGDFSGNVLLGYRVENGKIVGRIKDTMVSGNIYRILKQIIAVGNDRQWVGSRIMAPSLMVGDLAVASR